MTRGIGDRWRQSKPKSASIRPLIQQLLSRNHGVIPRGAMAEIAAEAGVSREYVRQIMAKATHGTYLVENKPPRLCRKCGLPLSVRTPTESRRRTTGYHRRCYEPVLYRGKCGWCGKEIVKHPIGASKSGLRFCNRVCRSRWSLRAHPPERVRTAFRAQSLGWTPDRIVAVRTHFAMSRREFAILLGISQSALIGWEIGRSRIGTPRALKALERLERRT